jgi:hypothetical protein
MTEFPCGCLKDNCTRKNIFPYQRRQSQASLPCCRRLLPVHQRARARHLRMGIQAGRARAQQGGVPLTEGPHLQGQGETAHCTLPVGVGVGEILILVLGK